jgi:hypothetical protein
MALEEYRIRYRHDHAVKTSFHYYMAESAEEAKSFHDYMADKKHLDLQTLSIEYFDRYAEKWKSVIIEYNYEN